MGAKDFQSCRRTSRFECSSVCSSSLHSGLVGSAAGSSRWAYALRSGVWPPRRRARRTESAPLEVAVQSPFQEKFSHSMAVRGLLDGGSATVRRMRAFAVADEMVRVACRWRWQLLSPIRQRPRCMVCPPDLEPR